MTIRKARMSDIPVLNELLQDILQVHHQVRPDIFRSSGQKFSEEELSALLDNPTKPVFVYEVDGKVVGHLFCELATATGDVLEPAKTLFIDDLCVVRNSMILLFPTQRSRAAIILLSMSGQTMQERYDSTNA